MRADNFFRDARQSFEKGKKEGREKESLSLSSKIELYVIVLTIVTTSSSQERIIRWSIFRRNDVRIR